MTSILRQSTPTEVVNKVLVDDVLRERGPEIVVSGADGSSASITDVGLADATVLDGPP